MESNIKPAFVTGGTGLLGSHLICRLLMQDIPVRAIHRQSSNRDIVKKVIGYYSDKPQELFNRIEWCECDIRDYDRLLKALNGTDTVYHCAAAVSFGTGQKDYIIKNNVLGTGNIVRACIENGIKKLCHVSSNSALGACSREIMVNETHIWNDSGYHSPYAMSKYLSEAEVWKGIEKGLNAVIVNPTFILGPGDWKRGTASFFTQVDKGMLFFTDGISGFVDVNDVVNAMICLTSGNLCGERYIVSAENLSFREVFAMIARYLEVTGPRIKVPEMLSHLVLPAVRVSEAVTGKQSPLTRDVLKSAWSRITYDNNKIINSTGISFTPIEKAIGSIASIYLSEKNRMNR